jgi:hypothetical protein
VAVASMKKKEKSQFIFLPEYYCGKMGCEPRVPRETSGKQTIFLLIKKLEYKGLRVVVFFQFCLKSKLFPFLNYRFWTNFNILATKNEKKFHLKKFCKFAIA